MPSERCARRGNWCAWSMICWMSVGCKPANIPSTLRRCGWMNWWPRRWKLRRQQRPARRYLEVQTNPLSVSGDTGRLEQILLNLLNNAMTYAPQSKQIDVRVRQVENEAEVQVQDYGQGIPQADLPHLFSRFYQAARSDRQTKRGLGLGLYIVRELVTAHNGRISVDSSEGKGTTFTIRLPLLLPEKEGQPAPKDAPGGSSKPFQR